MSELTKDVLLISGKVLMVLLHCSYFSYHVD